jgi:hypothetical protein
MLRVRYMLCFEYPGQVSFHSALFVANKSNSHYTICRSAVQAFARQCPLTSLRIWLVHRRWLLHYIRFRRCLHLWLYNVFQYSAAEYRCESWDWRGR